MRRTTKDASALPARAAGVLLLAAAAGCATMGGGAPSGSDEKPSADDQKLMAEVGGKAKGLIVWSSSQLGLFRCQTS